MAWSAARPTVLRELEQEFGGRRFHMTLVLSDEPPPADHISTAHCLAFDGDRIVLARHVDRDWTIPGGHLEPGETAEQAMRREAMEEAGIEVGAAELVAHERIDALDGLEPSSRYRNPAFQVFYVAAVAGWGVITATGECTEARLFTPDEARDAPGWVQRNRTFYEAVLGRVVNEATSAAES